ncbi:MAG: hypothetical protein GY924_22170, partial [Planctomycetaceae bacterium]|nr:hypothetical protein [Planctomycetaceae bacterium]
IRLQPRKTIKVTITNPTKEDIVLDRHVQIGHLETVDVLTVDEAVGDIMRQTQDGPTIGMSQATPEELYDRLEKVKAIARQQLPEELRDHPSGLAMIALLVQHHEALSLSDREMGVAKDVMHDIDTGQSKPIALPIRRMPYGDRAEVKKQLEDLLAAGVIKHSKSEWAFPTVLVRK